MAGPNIPTSSEPSIATFGPSSGSDEGTGFGASVMAVPAIADSAMNGDEYQVQNMLPIEDADMGGGRASTRASSKRRTLFYIGDDVQSSKRSPSTQPRIGRSVSPRGLPKKPGSSQSSDQSRKSPVKVDDKLAKPGRGSPVRTRSVPSAQVPATAEEVLDAVIGSPPVDTIKAKPSSADVLYGDTPAMLEDARAKPATNGADPSDAQSVPRHEGEQHGRSISPRPSKCSSCEILKEQLERSEYLKQQERHGYQEQLRLSREQVAHLAQEIRLQERNTEEHDRERARSEHSLRQEAKAFGAKVETESMLAEQKFANLQTENNNIRSDLAVSDAKAKSLEDAINGLRTELTRCVENGVHKDETIARLERNIQKSAEYDQQGKTELAFQLATAENVLGDVQADLTAAKAEVDKLKGQNSRGQLALEERATEAIDLRNRIAELEQSSHVVSGKLRDKETMLENAQRELLSIRAHDAERNAALPEGQDPLVEVLRRQSESSNQRVRDLEQQLADCVDEKGALAALLTNCDRERDALVVERDESAKDKSVLESNIEVLRTRVGGTHEEKLALMKEHRATLAQRDEQIRSLNEKYEQERRETHSLRSRMAASTTLAQAVNLTGITVKGEASGSSDQKTVVNVNKNGPARAVSFDDEESKSRNRSRSVGSEQMVELFAALQEVRAEVKALAARGQGGPPGGPPGGGGGGGGDDDRNNGGAPQRGRGRSPTIRGGASSSSQARGGGGPGGPPDDPDDGNGGGDDGDEEYEEGEEWYIEEGEEEYYYWNEDEHLDDATQRKRMNDAQALLMGADGKIGKEAETIKVPSFPTAANLVNWRIQVGENLCAASGRSDFAEISWFREASMDTATFESLADSGARRFQSLDLKLAASMNSMIKTANADFSMSVTLRKQDAEAEGRMLTGRQIAWLIYKFYQANPNLTQMYTVRDLTNIPYRGDDHLHAFHFVWQSMLKHMGSDVLDEKTLRETLLSKIKFSKALNNDLGHYYRQPEGHPDKSYDFLIRAITSYVARTAQDRQQQASMNVLSAFETQLKGNKALSAAGQEADPRSKSAKARARRQAAQAAAQAAAREKDPALAAKGDPKGKGKGKRGKGKGKKGGPKGGDKVQSACYFHNHGGCTRDNCRYKHVLLSKEEREKMPKPASRAPSANGDKPSPRGSPGPGKGATGFGYCRDFLKSTTCKRGDKCPYAHMTEDMVKEVKRAQANRKKS